MGSRAADTMVLEPLGLKLGKYLFTCVNLIVTLAIVKILSTGFWEVLGK